MAMAVERLNVLSCELDESLDRAGFRHAGASIGHRIGALRLGAAVYQADAGRPIFPYHYHYAAEEWMYVISGAPVLRDAGGLRPLSSGDVVCFPPGHLGAHTMSGPGRFIVFSTDAPGPYVAVYPDSDKIAVALDVVELNVLALPRAAAVDYWYGEGTEAPSDPVDVVREPAAPSRPVINALAVPVGAQSTDAPAGFRSRVAMLASAPGAQRLDAIVLELDPGKGSAEYHYAYGREEWALVLAGMPTLRHPYGEDVLQAGDVVCFAEGPAGAHRLINRGHQVVRMMLLSTTRLPVNVCYPDSGRWWIRNEPDAEDLMLREAEPVGDRDGEA
jgi:uncharacterized cupin superfamily protein